MISVSVSKDSKQPMEESSVEICTAKLGKLQQGKNNLEEDVRKAQSESDSLQEELAYVQAEAYQLEGIRRRKEESCRFLQFQCEEAEKDCIRQLKLNKRTEDTLDDYRQQIQDVKLKHRMQWMTFETQLCLLIDQHKYLHSVFTSARLPGEIESAEDTCSQLLATEQLKLAQLRHLEEALERVEKPDQPERKVTKTQKQ